MKSDGSTVALKIFVRRKRTSDESKLLNKEARILLGIKPHLHIVGVCATPKFYGLLCEFVNGGNLTQLLASSDPEVEIWDNRLEICRQVATGMSHLHGNCPPVIHLDLKPQNVLIEKVEQMERTKGAFLCKICDFGLSKMAEVSSITQDRSDGSTPSGTVTVHYTREI
eukprot:m.216231 g.216231  ORF g.216231 m.216231 type:complete len:168 (+) comp39854_c0_seq17:1761-2264(+)